MSTMGNGQIATEIDERWLKSSYSGPQGNCVEVARLASGEVAVRNSRYPDGPALIFTESEWDAFLAGARDGEFGQSD